MELSEENALLAVGLPKYTKEILETLASEDRGFDTIEIETKTQIRQPAMSKAGAALVSLGILKRESDPKKPQGKGRRRNIYRLEKGYAQIIQAKKEKTIGNISKPIDQFLKTLEEK